MGAKPQDHEADRYAGATPKMLGFLHCADLSRCMVGDGLVQGSAQESDYVMGWMQALSMIRQERRDREARGG